MSGASWRVGARWRWTGERPASRADAAAAGARFGRRAAAVGDAEHAHRLEPERELLAAVGRADVEPGELPHALEAVADRVAVGEQPLGGAGDVAVGLEEGLDASARARSRTARRRRRAARPSRRRSAAARPGPRSSRSAAAGRRPTPRRRARAARRRPRRRWRPAAPRRRRGAGRPGRGAGGCARARRCGRAGRSAARAGRPRPRARAVASSAPGQEDHDLGARRASARAASTAAAPGSDGARAALGHGEHALAPAVLGRHVRVGARDDDARALDEVDARARRRAPRMSSRPEMSRSSSACRKPASACSEARSGARTRSTSEAISVVTSRTSAALASPRARMRSVPTGASATRSSIASTPAASSSSERSSAGERAATASTAPARSVSTRLASSARAAARTTSGRPAPDSTASVIASSAARSSPVAGPWAGVDMHRFYGEASC